MYSTKTVSSQTTSPWIPLDDNQAAFNATIGVTVSGTLTYSVEFTLDNIQDPSVTPTAFATTLVGETVSKSVSIQYPIKAVRLNVTSFTSGSAIIGARQGTDNSWGYPEIGETPGAASIAYDSQGRVSVYDEWTMTYDSTTGRVESQTNGVLTRTFTYDTYGRYTGYVES